MSEPVLNKAACRFIPVARPTVGALERHLVNSALDRCQLSQGAYVEEFEREMAAAHGRKVVGVACNSGYTALVLALKAAGIGRGQMVACPAMTMVAVPNAILAAGAKPLFIDSEPDSGNISLDELDDEIKRRDCGLEGYSAPLVWVLPHLYGVPIEFQKFGDITAIEDCAESHFARFSDGTSVGSRGDFACFSFFGNKLIACGEGGMVLPPDRESLHRLRGLRAHAFTAGEHFHHSEQAYGYRLTELGGALGCAQMQQRHDFVVRRREIFNRYMDGLRSIDWIQFQKRTEGSADWVMPLLVKPDSGLNRDIVRQSLAEVGVETRSFFKPLHTQPHLSQYANGQEFPVADDWYRRGLYLPLHCSMTDGDVDYIVERLAGLRA